MSTIPENTTQVSREPLPKPDMAPTPQREASAGSQERSKLIYEAARQDLQRELQSGEKKRSCCCVRHSELDADSQGICAS